MSTIPSPAAAGNIFFDPHQIARLLGGEVSGRHSVLAPGPGHGRRDRSLSIKVDPGASSGLLIHSFAGDDWRACRDYVFGALGISPQRSAPPRPPRSNVPKQPSELGLGIWHESVRAQGTLAETYLAFRDLVLPPTAELRFHSSCPFGGERHPCMVGLYRDIATNEPRAIHRTALTPDGKKIDRKALGPKSGCAIKLTADEDVSLGLAIAEGVETALAGMALGFTPAWALGDAHGVAAFPVLVGIEALTILVDRDESGTGQAAALECSRRWTAAGTEVFRVIPNELGADMADVVRAA